MENNTNISTLSKNKELNNTVVDSLKFLEKLLGNIINHTETVYNNETAETTQQLLENDTLPQYVANKLQGILHLFADNNKEHYCDLIAKTANNETFSINSIIEQFKQIEWITNGYHSIEAKLIDSPNFEQSINAVNNLLMQYMSGKLVAFYVINNNNTLKLLNQCSSNKDLNLPKTITKGSGELGVLLENNYTFLGATPDELLSTNDGLFPKYTFCMPILMNNTIEGMLFIGKDIAFTTQEKKFLNICQSHLAAYLVYNRTKNQLISGQNTIEEQTEKLKAQSSELSSQKENLAYHKSKAEALEKKTLTLNDALNQKTQNIESLEEKIDSLNQNLANKTKTATILEKNTSFKEQELIKITEKANNLEKQLLEKNQRFESVNEKLVTAERSISIQNSEIESLNTELHQTKAIINKQTEALNIANSKADYLDCLANTLKATANEYFSLSKQNTSIEELTHSIQHGKEELLRLITDLQELSNIQNNNVDIQISPSSLSEIFTSLTQQFQPIAKQKGLTFSIEQSNEICNYQKTDSTKLQKILQSLLAYSFKSTDIGAIRIKTHQPEHIASKNIFAISISDTGAGLSEQKQKTIFEPFNADQLHTNNETGLTLKLAYEYAKLLGADLHVKSQEGLGTTFTLYLPIADCNTDELHNTYDHNKTTITKQQNQTTELDSNTIINQTINEVINNKHQSILVMHEDDTYKGINKLLKTVVKETELVTTADQAYKQIKKAKHNCIIISLQHPDLPGFKWLISQLKREGMAIPACVLYVPYTMNTRENELSKKYIRDYGVKLATSTDELLEEIIQILCSQLNES